MNEQFYIVNHPLDEFKNGHFTIIDFEWRNIIFISQFELQFYHLIENDKIKWTFDVIADII